MFEKILIENGLNAKEAKLYLAILEAGELTFGQCAQKTHLKRSTVYSLSEGLRQKGIVTLLKKRGVQYISALSPRLLVERFTSSAERAKAVLPQLMDLAYNSRVKPRIRFSEGTQAIKDVLLEAASSKRDYIGFIDYALMPKEIYRYIRSTVAPERAKNGNLLRLLMPRNTTNLRILSEYTQMIEHRLIDFPTHGNHIEILLYAEGKIGCMSFVKNEMFAVVIDSEAIYRTLYDLFLFVWDYGDPVDSQRS